WRNMGSGCENENCSHGSGFPEDCLDQDCHSEEPLFGLIELVCVTVIYVPLMLFGLLGNILTILVVWLRPHMRSSTYLYLSSMAVSDLLILLLLPLDLYKLWRPRPWPLGDLACKLTMFLSECCTFCTILHITFLSLERYLAVCWPITAKTVLTRRRTRALIGCLWLGAAVSAAPVLVMVGVEDVGGEELELGGWREDGGWASSEVEQGGYTTGGGEGGSGHNGRLEEKEWGEKTKEWAKGVGESKCGADGGGEVDNRECRCTQFAVSSGLLSAMMVLSNLYFLVPLCTLGLVYSLIGRTLCLRPQSSRRDQSHRHTVKMLGVIVLAFVLCWLPFHVGRTIFSLSMGTDSDAQDGHTDTDVHADIDGLTDADTNFSHLDSHAPFETHPGRFTHMGDANTTRVQSGTPARAHSQNDTPDHTPPAVRAHTATPTGPYDGDDARKYARNDTRSAGPHNQPDTHSYFLYYLSQYFNLVSSVLFFLSAAVNPLLYNLMSAKYRNAVRSLARADTQSRRLRTLTSQPSTTTL
uniref:G-protein coupled receptors family 1 profile domain-containing protein n=1 Tax=Gasterosteus aculeatus TaxID=69293 RepID=G3NR78_GASAC